MIRLLAYIPVVILVIFTASLAIFCVLLIISLIKNGRENIFWVERWAQYALAGVVSLVLLAILVVELWGFHLFFFSTENSPQASEASADVYGHHENDGFTTQCTGHASYNVASGDTLLRVVVRQVETRPTVEERYWSDARSVTSLVAEVNGIDPNRLTVNQEIVLPTYCWIDIY